MTETERGDTRKGGTTALHLQICVKSLSSANLGFARGMESWLPSAGRKEVKTALLGPVLSLQQPPPQQDAGGRCP